MVNYWVKYSYTSYNGKNNFGNHYSIRSTLEEFVEFSTVEWFKNYCAELQQQSRGVMIESIVKL